MKLFRHAGITNTAALMLAALAAITSGGILCAQEYPVSGVLVSHDDRAIATVNDALSARKNGEWERTVRKLQMAIEDFPSALYPVDRCTHRNVRDFCLETLNALPDEAKQVYRGIYDAIAAKAFAAAAASADTGKLTEAMDRYPIATAVPSATADLAALLIERGDFVEARRVLGRLSPAALQSFPPERISAVSVWFCRLGMKESLEALSASVRGKPGESAEVRLAGRRMTLRRLIDILMSRTRPAVNPTNPDNLGMNWAAFGGDSSRNMPMAPDTRLEPKCWEYRVPVTGTRRRPSGMVIVDVGNERRSQTPDFPLMPALYENRVFVHNDVSVFALELLTKESRLCWRFDTDLREQLVQDERVLHTTTVANGIAYVPLVANIPESWRSENLFNLDVTCGFSQRAIYAFDAMGGKLLWSTADSTDEFLQAASFAMAPAFDSGNLYVGAVYMSEQNAPMEHFICCLDAATGRLKWKTYLCSGFLEVNLFNNPVRESLGSAVTISNGLVFYCSNMGAAAAVDLRDGRIVWLNRYRQFEIPPTRDFYPPLMPAYWANNPPVMCSGAVYFTPMDSPYLYGFDAATGQKRWEWSPIDGTYKYLLGASGDSLILTGKDMIALDVKRGLKIKWSVTPTENPAGRGGMSREFVYVPTEAALYKVGITGGKIAERTPWPSGFPRGGNFLMFNGSVVIASKEGVTACFNEEAMHSALRLQAEKTPKDPAALYRLGMSCVSRRQFAEALLSLSRVIEITRASGQENSPVAASARNAIQSVHVELARQKAAEGQPDEAIAEFVLAQKSSDDPRRSVDVAFAFAEQLVKLGRNDRAIEELQGVIERFPAETRDGGTAREQAAKMIADVILQAGRAPYAPQESKAAAMLDAARKTNDEEMLLKLVVAYPNSLASERAVLELARRQRGSGRLDQAIDTLRSFAKGSQKSAALPEALALLVECYETRGMYGSARGVLNQMQRRFAGTRLPEASGGASVAEFVKSRLALKEYAASTGSEKMAIEPPLKLIWQYQEPVGTVRVVRIAGAAPDGMPEIVLVETQKALVALSAVSGKALWQTPRAGALIGAGFCRGRLVLCDGASLTALDPKSGVREYSVPLKSRQVRSFKVGGEHVFISSFDPSQPTNMKLTCHDGQSGKEAWTHSVNGQFVSDPAVTDEWVVIAVAPSNEIIALEKETGAAVSAIPFGAPIAATLLLSPDRIFVADRSGMASCLELPSGKALWRQAIRGLRPDMTQANGTHLVLLSTSPSGGSTGTLCAIEAASGKLSLTQPIAAGEFPRNIADDDDRAYVVTRSASNSSQTTVNAYNLSKAGAKWTCPIETDGASTSFQPLVAEKHVLLGVSVFDATNRAWANRVYVMDSETGRLVQVLAPEGISNSPGTVELFDGVVVCVHGGHVVAYGRQ